MEIVVIENECDVYLYDKTNPVRESPWSWFGVVKGKDLPARSALPDLFIIKEC